MTTMDEYSRIRQATIGSTSASWGYDSNNMLSQIAATGVQQYNYSFDVNLGNLNSRTNFLKSKTESFGYDPNNLDRLATVTGPVNASVSYTPDKNGNILTKSDAGTYAYNETPYAVSDIGNHQNISSTPQSINYYSFEKVQDITEGSKTAEFVYNADQQRIRMTLKTSGATTKTRWYFGGSCEREQVGSTVNQYIWIGGDAYSAVAVAKKTGTGSWTVYNIFRDHLGTITHLKTGSTISEYSFDAWGRRRDKDDWTYTLSGEPALFADRGFTAHEYLDDFKLYNMNGRLYDPVVGRFLSPDPYVLEGDFTQGFNRYSYALNNPLVYVDQNGEFPFLAAGIFAVFSYLKTAHDNRDMETGKWAWNPLDWFKDEDFHMEIGVNTNTDFSDFTGYGGFGQWGQPTSSIAYNNNQGVGFGYHYPDGSNGFYYPSYNYNAAEQNALRNIAEARKANGEALMASSSPNINVISNVLNGASVGFNISIPNTNLNSGFSATLLSDHERNYAIALTLMSKPENPGVELGVSISRMRIISNTGNPVSFDDLRGYGEQYNAGFLMFEYSIGGSPDRVRSKASPYKIENFGIAFGFPVTLSGYSTYTWIFPLY